MERDEIEEMRRALLRDDDMPSDKQGHHHRPGSSDADTAFEADGSTAEPARTGAPRRSTLQKVLGGVGEVLITVGVLMLLMVAYQLWWTNVEGSQAIAAQRDEIIST